MTARKLTLCYHAVSDGWQDPVAVSAHEFERQLHWVASAGLRAGTLTDLARGGRTAPTLAITFDDAFRSVYDIAFPAMQRRGLVGVVFVPTSFPDSGRRLDWAGFDSSDRPPPPAEMEPMTWEQIGELRDAGWEVGSHTRRHRVLPELDDADLAEELAGSRDDVRAALGGPCAAVAFPYGATDARVRSFAAAAGYTVGAALVRRVAARDPLDWPRVGVYRGDGLVRLRLKCSRAAASRPGSATVLGAQSLGRAAAAVRRDVSGTRQ